MAKYIRVKKSQIHLFESIPFYYETGGKEYALYKKSGDRLPEARLKQIKYPELFIRESDKDAALKELMSTLNDDLKDHVSQGNLKNVREALGGIVEEALTPGQESGMNTLPATLDILLGRYDQDHKAMELLTQIASNSPKMVEHTVNVTALTLQYCFFHRFPQSDTRQIALAALLHDVGCANIDREIVESDRRLTDRQFKIYTGHPVDGHDMIIVNTEFDVAVPTVVLEHHERIDGSGYPNQLTRIASYSQLIGLIDCYESLTYHEKSFRKAKKPFDTLNLIKQEVIKGRFAKGLFKNFTSCLVK